MREDEQGWLAEATRSLWQHSIFIEAHSEFSHLLRSNHYLSNAVGLFCLCAFLKDKNSEKSRLRWQSRIESEMLHQVYADGGDKEASTGYHVLVMELFTSAYLIMRRTGMKI